MTEKSHETLPNDAEILATIVAEQSERAGQIKDYIRLSPHITGLKGGKATYSTPSPADKQKREDLVESWRHTERTYRVRLAGFGFILPEKDPYSPHPSAPVALQALRNNDPALFENDAQALLIAESILLRTVRERLKQTPRN